MSKEDRARMQVLPLGANDMFGPEARNSDSWRKKPELEQLKTMAQVVRQVDREDRSSSQRRQERFPNKSSRFRSAASGRRTSVDQRSPLLPLDMAAARSEKPSYSKKPGTFRRDQGQDRKQPRQDAKDTRRDQPKPRDGAKKDSGKPSSAFKGKGRGRGKP